jgi:hypothetical protein
MAYRELDWALRDLPTAEGESPVPLGTSTEWLPEVRQRMPRSSPRPSLAFPLCTVGKGLLSRLESRTDSELLGSHCEDSPAFQRIALCCGAPLDTKTDGQNPRRAVGSKRWLDGAHWRMATVRPNVGARTAR